MIGPIKTCQGSHEIIRNGLRLCLAALKAYWKQVSARLSSWQGRKLTVIFRLGFCKWSIIKVLVIYSTPLPDFLLFLFILFLLWHIQQQYSQPTTSFNCPLLLAQKLKYYHGPKTKYFHWPKIEQHWLAQYGILRWLRIF